MSAGFGAVRSCCETRFASRLFTSLPGFGSAISVTQIRCPESPSDRRPVSDAQRGPTRSARSRHALRTETETHNFSSHFARSKHPMPHVGPFDPARRGRHIATRTKSSGPKRMSHTDPSLCQEVVLRSCSGALKPDGRSVVLGPGVTSPKSRSLGWKIGCAG